MSPAENIIIGNAWICQLRNSAVFPVFGDIKVVRGKISEIVEKPFPSFIRSSSRKKYDLNAGGRIITIPLVNFHDHIYSRLAKGLSITGSMGSFKEILHNLWWKLDRILDEEMVRASAQMAALESIKNGVTYIFDHHSSPYFINQSLELISGILFENKIRNVACYEISDRNGAASSVKSLLENKNFAEMGTGDNIKAMLGIHASFTVSDDTLAEAAEIISELNLGIHIHLCEDKLDRTSSKEFANDYPVQRLKKYNLLNDKSILAHGIYLTKNDYAAIEENGSALVYNFDSNMNNAVGLPDLINVPEFVPRLVGTDGMNSNISKAMKTLFLLLRHQGHSFDSAFRVFQKIYFDQISFIRKYFDDFPSLQKNDRADFIIWDYIPPAPLTADNFWGHFVYGVLERSIHTVVQDGRFLLKNFLLLNIDEEKTWMNIYKQGERLSKKFNLPT